MNTNNQNANGNDSRGKLTLPDIEKVSAKVHGAWMEGKRSQGIDSRKAEDGEELMVPYDQLSETAKDSDRRTVNAVYKAIEELHEEENQNANAQQQQHTASTL